MQRFTKKILLISIPIILIVSFIALINYNAALPPTISIKYTEVQRTASTVGFVLKATLRNSDSVILNLENFTLNGNHPPMTHYPWLLQENTETSFRLSFIVPSNITEYKFGYTGLTGYKFVFKAV